MKAGKEKHSFKIRIFILIGTNGNFFKLLFNKRKFKGFVLKSVINYLLAFHIIKKNMR